MKKLLVLVSVLLFSTFSIFANGQNENSDKDSNKPVEITWISHYPETSVHDAIVAFEASHPNIKVDYQVGVQGNATETMKKVDLMLLGGEKCDVFWVPGIEFYMPRASSGSYLDLDQCFQDENLNYSDYFDIDASVDGKIYALPNQITFWYTLINQTYLEEAGLEQPPLDWTWEDFERYAKAMTVGEGADKRYGAYFHTWPDIFRLASYNVLDDNGIYTEDMKPNFDAPVFKNFLEYLNKLENVEGVAKPYADALSTKSHYNNFFNGDFAMTIIGSWTSIPENVIKDGKMPHDFTTTFAPLPRWKEGGTTGKTYSGLNFLTINAKTKHPKESFDFILWMATEGGRYMNQLRASKVNENELVIEDRIEKDGDSINKDAFLNVLNNRIDNPSLRMDTHLQDLVKIFSRESEIYLVGGQDIDITMNNIKNQSAALYK